MKQIRALLVGVVAGALLATSATAFAAGGFTKISALLRPDYTVKVDGKKVDMKNAPITYNNNTYIPLREAGNVLGYKVGFNNGTITLDSGSGGSTGEAATSLISLKELAFDYNVEVVIKEHIEIGDTIYFNKPDTTKDRSETIYFSGKKFTLVIKNGNFYVYLDEMKKLGIIPEK
ncbi:stalk domain-containing protein [Paenibacillus sp. NPDC058071]|uniref:stalk domain-containing protein n=1 Tax=Paenibacillus sp. NPDC058071 TaxID=3346326 RepID=UPI0036DB3BA4